MAWKINKFMDILKVTLILMIKIIKTLKKITTKIKVDKKWVDTGLSYKIIVEDPQVTTKKELKKGESINISDLIASSTTSFKAKDVTVQKTDIASVDSSGKITALAKGSTKVTFTLGGRTYKIKLKITE